MEDKSEKKFVAGTREVYYIILQRQPYLENSLASESQNVI